jgi:hypothetical protein
MRADRPLVLSGRASSLSRARAHSLVARGRLWLSRRRHFGVVGRRRRGRPRHFAPVDRRTGNVAAPRWLRRRVFIEGDAKLPRLPPLDAVVVSIALGDLAFLVLRVACRFSAATLFRLRRFGRNEVGALQLQRQEGVKFSRGRRAPRGSTLRQKQIRCIEKTNNSQLFLSPRWGSSGAAATAATSRSTS